VRVAPKQGDRERKWFKARVEEQVDIRSYEVRTEDGKLYRRNRRHLLQSKEPFGQTAETSPVVELQHNQTTSPTTAEPTRPQATGQPVQNIPVDLPKQTAGDGVPKPGATSHNKANHSCDKERTSLKGPTVLTRLCYSQIRTLEHYL